MISRLMDKLENKIVHLSAIHSITFENATNLLQQENNASLLQREIVLLTISFLCLTGKNPFFPLSLLHLYKKVRRLGCPK